MIRFETKNHPDVEMLDKHALAMLKMMGLSDAVPSALSEDRVETALENLKAAVAEQAVGDNWDDQQISQKTRAQPLIDLLTKALADNEHVMWQKNIW